MCGSPWAAEFPPPEVVRPDNPHRRNESAYGSERVAAIACPRSRFVIALVDVTRRHARRAIVRGRFGRAVAYRAFLMLRHDV